MESDDNVLKIGTDKAKMERLAQIEMARRDEEEIVSASVKDHKHLLESTAEDFALYNYILSVHDFTKYTVKDSGPADWMRILYEVLWPHINRVINDRRRLLFILENAAIDPKLVPQYEEIKSRMDPQQYAVDILNKVTKAARIRAKLKTYLPDDKIKL